MVASVGRDSGRPAQPLARVSTMGMFVSTNSVTGNSGKNDSKCYFMVYHN